MRISGVGVEGRDGEYPAGNGVAKRRQKRERHTRPATTTTRNKIVRRPDGRFSKNVFGSVPNSYHIDPIPNLDNSPLTTQRSRGCLKSRTPISLYHTARESIS